MASTGLDPFDELQYWKLSDVLTLPQAACLILNIEPSALGSEDDQFWLRRTSLPLILFEDFQYDQLDSSFRALLEVLRGAVESENLPSQSLTNATGLSSSGILVSVSELKRWLKTKNMLPAFFFGERPDQSTEFLDPDNPRYSTRLAAAVRAWQAVTDTKGISPKQALTNWLNENAKELGLVDKQGTPIKQTIEDIAKVANWQITGGAPKTPG